MSEAPIVALALGGGAARGLAHIGVLEVFDEHKIPVDLIVGCSMGSVVGAMYACGTPAKMIHGIAGQLFAADYRKIFDITLPRLGLVRGQRIDTIIRTVLGDREFCQMKIPFAAVATCLGDNVLKVFNEGKVANAVRASISIPGIFEPVTCNNRTLVDGALVNPVPTSVCRAYEQPLVVAVNLNYDIFGRSAVVKHSASFQAVEPPRNKTEHHLGLPGVMVQAFNIIQERISRARLAGDPPDLALHPRLSDIGLSEFHRAGEAIDRGYAETMNQIAALQRMQEVFAR